MKKTLHWIDLSGMPIFEQLQLEEALLRTDTRSFCIVNRGSPRSIVLGISSKAEELVDVERAQRDQIPLSSDLAAGGRSLSMSKLFLLHSSWPKGISMCQPSPSPFSAGQQSCTGKPGIFPALLCEKMITSSEKRSVGATPNTSKKIDGCITLLSYGIFRMRI